MNIVALIGRLTKDVEVSYVQSTGTAIGKFTLAVDRPKRDGKDQGADFIRVVVFGKQAETCSKYISKGKQVAVEGRIQTGSYKNNKGDTVYTTDILASRIEFLGGGQSVNKSAGPAQSSFGPSGHDDGGYAFDDIQDSFDAAEEDMPF